MIRPSVYALRKARVEEMLDGFDPDWRNHFSGDWQRAEEFYRPHQRLINGGGGVEPPEYENIPRDCCDD